MRILPHEVVKSSTLPSELLGGRRDSYISLALGFVFTQLGALIRLLSNQPLEGFDHEDHDEDPLRA